MYFLSNPETEMINNKSVTKKQTRDIYCYYLQVSSIFEYLPENIFWIFISNYIHVRGTTLNKVRVISIAFPIYF